MGAKETSDDQKKARHLRFSREQAVPLLKILAGNCVMGLAYAKWMVPNKIINGGVTSLSLVMSKLSRFSLVAWTNGITLALLFCCLIFLGKGNFFKFLFSSVTYLFFFNLFYDLPFSLHTWVALDLMLACCAIAFGYYCCISSNSSTVGVDVIALILHHRNPKRKIAPMIRNLNFCILILGLLTYGIPSVLLGVLFSFVYSWMLKKFLHE